MKYFMSCQPPCELVSIIISITGHSTHLGQLPREDKQRVGGEMRGVRAIINSSVSFRICEKRAVKNISDFSTSGLRK